VQLFCTTSRLGPGLNAAVSSGSDYEIGFASTANWLVVIATKETSAAAAILDRVMIGLLKLP
jgi:hypothetical protein